MQLQFFAQQDSTYKLKIALFFLMLLHLLIFWPGILSPDSASQYQQAISGVFSNHHPPLMSFIWRYLDKLVKGSGLILVLHMALLYTSVYYLIKSLENFRYKYLALLFPFIPQIFIYSGMIWKDVGFAFSFLYVGCFLAYLTSQKRPFSKIALCILWLIFFYGTSVKFQAKYCAPVFLIWLAYCLSFYSTKKIILKSILLILPFYLALNITERLLVPPTQENHSWQLVKLYDLAGISVTLNQDLFPDFVKGKNFTLENLKKTYNTVRVDDLVFIAPPLLTIGKNPEERNKLWHTWFQAVTTHPIVYLKHRTLVLISGLTTSPAQNYIPVFFEKLAQKKHFYTPALIWILKIGVFIFLTHLLAICLSFTYLVLGIFSLKLTWAAIPLFCFNATGLLMTSSLFVFSMAGSTRYNYISLCMVHASHLFAFICARTQYFCYKKEPYSIV